MNDPGKEKEAKQSGNAAEAPKKLPEKKRKTEPEVTIAPSGAGGPDILVE